MRAPERAHERHYIGDSLSVSVRDKKFRTTRIRSSSRGGQTVGHCIFCRGSDSVLATIDPDFPTLATLGQCVSGVPGVSSRPPKTLGCTLQRDWRELFRCMQQMDWRVLFPWQDGASCCRMPQKATRTSSPAAEVPKPLPAQQHRPVLPASLAQFQGQQCRVNQQEAGRWTAGLAGS